MIDIKKNPETVGKLKVGTSAAIPADGELLVSGNLGVGCDPERELEVSGPGNVYTRITAQTENDSTALELKNTGGTWTIINDDTASETLKFKNGGSASDVRLAIDASGNVTVNGDTTVENYGSYRNLVLRRAQGTSASPTTIANTQTLGKLSFSGYTGSVYREGASIAGKVTRTVSGDEIPSSLVFSTTANGETSPTARLTIDDSGAVTLSNGVTVSGGFLSLGTPTELTIATSGSLGAITVTRSFHEVDTEGDNPTDDLDTINGGSAGDIVTLKTVTGSRDVTVKDGTGNLRLAGDFTLNSPNDSITLIKYSTVWIEMSRSDNV